jgi:quinol monooxygenase YgiN
MITRIVQMTFDPARVAEFLKVFEESKHRIANSPGCLHLELNYQADQPNVLYTISRWNSEDDLQNYRSSELFLTTWAKTKVLFAGKPQAWTLFPSGVISLRE